MSSKYLTRSAKLICNEMREELVAIREYFERYHTFPNNHLQNLHRLLQSHPQCLDQPFNSTDSILDEIESINLAVEDQQRELEHNRRIVSSINETFASLLNAFTK